MFKSLSLPSNELFVANKLIYSSYSSRLGFLTSKKVSPVLGNTRTSPYLLCYFSNGKTGRPNGGSGSWSEPKEGWKIFHIESKSFEIVLGGGGQTYGIQIIEEKKRFMHNMLLGREEAAWLRSTPIRFSHYTFKTELPRKLYGIRHLPDPKIQMQPTLICNGVLR